MILDYLLHYWWQVTIGVAVILFALGVTHVVVGVLCLSVGRAQAPARAREERDAARAERDDLRREAVHKDADIARLRGELATMRGLGAQVMSTAARLVNAYDAPSDADQHVIAMGKR